MCTYRRVSYNLLLFTLKRVRRCSSFYLDPRYYALHTCREHCDSKVSTVDAPVSCVQRRAWRRRDRNLVSSGAVHMGTQIAAVPVPSRARV